MRRCVELSGFLGISHLVGQEAMTGRTYSTKHILIGKGATGTSIGMGPKSIVRVRFKAEAIGIRILRLRRAAGGRRTGSLFGCLWDLSSGEGMWISR